MERKLKKLLNQGKFNNVSEERSRTMSAIRAKHTRTTEYRLRMALVRRGIKGWKLHDRELPGKPDFYFAEQKLAVFVDGCFWHGCPKCGHFPKTNEAFWKAKINRNRRRDIEITKTLRSSGFSVIRFWEHELRENITRCTDKVLMDLGR